MGAQERICRLCLKICDNFKAIEGDMKNMLGTVMPKMDLAAIPDPVVCTNCSEMLIKYSDFKAACFCTRDYADRIVNSKNATKLDLVDVYLSINENGTGVAKDQDICGFCMTPVKKRLAISVDVEKEDVLKNMIERCLPELDLSIIKKPVICAPCHGSLENCFHFMTNFLTVEEQIKQYPETFDINGKDEIELDTLLQFSIKDIIKSEDTNPVDIIKTEKELCWERENADKSEIDKGESIVKSEEIFCDDSENIKVEVKHENESYMAGMDGFKFCNEEQFTPKGMFTCKEERNNFDVIKTEEAFCGEKEPKKETLVEAEDQKFIVNEEIDIKTEESDFSRFEEQNYLKEHILVDPSEVKMYKCDFCAFQTKDKYYIRDHLLLHKDSPEVIKYKCDSCSYQTIKKYRLALHVLVHKNSSELTLYKCDSCSFQTKTKDYLRRHSVMHKDSSEISMYKCDDCTFQTKQKRNLKGHLLLHKKPSEITMHKCNYCSFETKHKYYLNQHFLMHKDFPEVRTFQCSLCSYKTKCNRNLTRHFLKHKSPSEVTMYKCDICSFQTKTKKDLKPHLLIHKDPSEVKMSKCHLCPFQSKRGRNLKRHLLLHKDPSEVTMYKCDSCSFETKQKSNLTKHQMVLHVTS